MKQLVCEMCGSSDLVKQDGFFICQFCGCKYSVEEAKKMMIEGTVDIKGTVAVDISQELIRLYEVARRARDDNNSENAQKYYDQILIKDPSSWEANFYTVLQIPAGVLRKNRRRLGGGTGRLYRRRMDARHGVRNHAAARA